MLVVSNVNTTESQGSLQIEEAKGLQERVRSILHGQGTVSQGFSWDLLAAVRAHPWLRAAIASIGRTVVGIDWAFTPVDGESRTKRQLRELKEFFDSPPDRDFANFQDFLNPTAKLYLTAGCYKLFGVAAWSPVRNGLGKAIGYDYVWGVVEPNVDEDGNFLTPAWYVYSRPGQFKPLEYEKPDDLIVFLNPDFGGLPYSTDLEALLNYTLPSDIWAMVSYLRLHSQRAAPHDGVWVVPRDVSDDVYKKTQAMIFSRYMGAQNYGYNPIVAKGDLEFKPTRRGEDEAPYAGGRDTARQEVAGVVGTSGAQMGVSDEMTRSNLQQLRTQAHESTISPLLRMIEDTIYSQVCIREFGAPGWMLKFNAPDFLTVIERSGVGTRMRERGAMTSDEMRKYVLNMKPKPDGSGADDWLYPTNMVAVGSEQGGPPEFPQDGSDDTGDDGSTDETPPRTDDPDQNRVLSNSAIGELRQWRSVYKRTLSGKRKPKQFQANYIPAPIYGTLSEVIEAGTDPEVVFGLFDAMIQVLCD